MTIAAELAARVAEDDRLELFRPPTTGVVLWRARGHSLERIRGELRGSFASLADINGERWFRSVAANPLADPHLLVDETLGWCDSGTCAHIGRPILLAIPLRQAR